MCRPNSVAVARLELQWLVLFNPGDRRVTCDFDLRIDATSPVRDELIYRVR
jgi:hypothetical protein